jgi:GNAT superfamily N-acetyltransferase
LHESPLSLSWFSEIVKIYLRAFSNGNGFNWDAATPADAVITDSLDNVDSLGAALKARLQKTIRDFIHRELNPQFVYVCALIDKKIVGFALWRVPLSSRSQRETSLQKMYRKTIQFADCMEDWVFPATWRRETRCIAYRSRVKQCEDKYLGKGEADEAWRLWTLAVDPSYQRRGIGGLLVDWGLNQARAKGAKAYTDASPFGKGLYLKKGFKIVENMIVCDDGDQLEAPFMVWNGEL